MFAVMADAPNRLKTSFMFTAQDLQFTYLRMDVSNKQPRPMTEDTHQPILE